MFDETQFLAMLRGFASKLLVPYDVEDVLDDLMSTLVTALDLVGSGVALAEDGELAFTTAQPERVLALEQVQVAHQLGPCTEAFRTGAVVAVSDLDANREKWPDYCAAAAQAGLRAVAGIPMHLAGAAVGAVNLYDTGPREWSETDLAAAQVVADMATSYLINASKLRQEELLNEQLRHALESSRIIEQAKGTVAALHGVDVDQAFERIRSHARSHNVTVLSVSEAIVRLGLTI